MTAPISYVCRKKHVMMSYDRPMKISIFCDRPTEFERLVPANILNKKRNFRSVFISYYLF